MEKRHKIILGIDPGTVIMGYCIIEAVNNQITVRDMDVLKLPAKKDNYERLQLIHEKVTQLVVLHTPHQLAIEAPFFGKNVQSMLKLGRAQGVAIAAAMNHHIPVTEYSPRKIKQSITGNGNADKEQVWKMLLHLVSVPEKPKYFDATDALAVAICHYYSIRVPANTPATKSKKESSWQKFISQNPGRVL